LLLDGGMGTSLIARGLDLAAEPPELWNLEHPDHVREVHRRFLEAGCGAIQTNTFGGNRLRLGSYRLADRVAELNRAAVEVARSAAPEGVLVVGCIGPTGAIPPPQGDADLLELEDAFAEQATILASGPIDLLHLETFYHPKELRAALRGCRAAARNLPVVASVACKRIGATYATAMGFPADTAIHVALEEDADGIGLNCNLTPSDMLPMIERLVARTSVPIFAQPIIAPSGAAPLYPDEFASGVAVLFAVGAHVVGGCCGTSPTDLAAAHDALALEWPAQEE
jgi:5-methyltetrahydrofolate--homocysteine methyltransferase